MSPSKPALALGLAVEVTKGHVLFKGSTGSTETLGSYPMGSYPRGQITIPFPDGVNAPGRAFEIRLFAAASAGMDGNELRRVHPVYFSCRADGASRRGPILERDHVLVLRGKVGGTDLQVDGWGQGGQALILNNALNGNVIKLDNLKLKARIPAQGRNGTLTVEAMLLRKMKTGTFVGAPEEAADAADGAELARTSEDLAKSFVKSLQIHMIFLACRFRWEGRRDFSEAISRDPILDNNSPFTRPLDLNRTNTPPISICLSGSTKLVLLFDKCHQKGDGLIRAHFEMHSSGERFLFLEDPGLPGSCNGGESVVFAIPRLLSPLPGPTSPARSYSVVLRREATGCETRVPLRVAACLREQLKRARNESGWTETMAGLFKDCACQCEDWQDFQQDSPQVGLQVPVQPGCSGKGQDGGGYAGLANGHPDAPSSQRSLAAYPEASLDKVSDASRVTDMEWSPVSSASSAPLQPPSLQHSSPPPTVNQIPADSPFYHSGAGEPVAGATTGREDPLLVHQSWAGLLKSRGGARERNRPESTAQGPVGQVRQERTELLPSGGWQHPGNRTRPTGGS